MSEKIFKKGTIFKDRYASNIQGSKPKYFIGMNDADFEDDIIVSFVFNTELEPNNLSDDCNEDKYKFVFKKNILKFQNRETSLMLNKESKYTLKEMLSNDIEIIETIDDNLARQIKNCIDKNNISIENWNLIQESFKIKK